MAKYTDDIERLFTEGFENFEHDVSDKVWNNIDAELFSEPNITQSNAKIISLSILPIALLIGMALAVSEPQPANTHAVAKVIEVPIPPSEENNERTQVAINTEEEQGDEEMFLEEVVDDTQNDEQVDENFLETYQLQEEEIEEEEKDMMQKQSSTPPKKVVSNKEMPSLSEKPYLNHNFYKEQSAQMYSRYSINKLSKGVLLVRLKTGKRGIEELEKRGMHKKAEKYQTEIDKENKQTIKAFLNNYNFCEVRFFYSDQSDKVRDMEFSNIFLTPELEVDPTLTLDPSQTFYMILDIGPLRIPESDEIVNSGAALSRAIVIKDRDFEQMYRPFPFYVRAANQRLISHQVAKLNASFRFYHSLNKAQYSN